MKAKEEQEEEKGVEEQEKEEKGVDEKGVDEQEKGESTYLWGWMDGPEESGFV